MIFLALFSLKVVVEKPFIIIDENTGDIFGHLAASIHKKGIDHKYRIQDLWLASQAIQGNLKLLTRKERKNMG